MLLLLILVLIFIGCGDSGDDHWNNHFDVLHSHEHQHSCDSKPHRHGHTHWIEGGHASNEALEHYDTPNPKWKYGNDHSWLGEKLHYEKETATRTQCRP